MSDSIYQVNMWHTWRVAAEDDTPDTNFRPADIPDSPQLISVGDATCVRLRGYGYKASSPSTKTAGLRIVGWMGDKSGDEPGPGQILWNGVLTLGAISINEPPVTDSAWGSLTWNEVNDWDSSTGSNAALAAELAGGDQSLLILPTLGYKRLSCEITNLGGATEMDRLGLLWSLASRAQNFTILMST